MGQAKAYSAASIQASPQARKTACVILEVLSGVRSTTEASEVLSVSLPRYYVLETRGIEGLVKALEPKEKGRRSHSPQSRLDAMTHERDRLQTELGRMRSLVRLAQRTVGIPVKKKKGKEGKKRLRRTNRTRKVLALLKGDTKTPAVKTPAESG